MLWVSHSHPTGMNDISAMSHASAVMAHSLYCCHRSGLLSFLSHISEFSEHGIWTKALNIYPVSEGDFSFNAIEIIALNNRVTVIH